MQTNYPTVNGGKCIPMKQRKILTAVLTSFMLLSACSSQKAVESTAEAVSAEPVTLKVSINSTFMTDEEFERFVVQPVKKQHPNITIEKVVLGGGTKLENLIAAGDSPDVHFQATL